MSNNTEKVRMSPAARRLAREKGIDVAELAKIKADDIVIKAADIDQLEEDAIQLSERMSEIAALLVTLRKNTARELSSRLGVIRAENAQREWARAVQSQHKRLEQWRTAHENRLIEEREAARRRFALLSWQASKKKQEERLHDWYTVQAEKQLALRRERRRLAAQAQWQRAKAEQGLRADIFITKINDARLLALAEEKRVNAQARWLLTKAEQDDYLANYILEREEKQRLKRAAARRQQAENSWAAAKAAHDALRERWLARKARERAEKLEEERLLVLRAEKIAAARESWQTAAELMRLRADTWIERKLHENAINRQAEKRARALRDWQRAKSLGDRRIEAYTIRWEAQMQAAYEAAYGEIVREDVISAVLSASHEKRDIRSVAHAIGSALADIASPLYSRHIINLVELSDSDCPIKHIMQPHASAPDRIRIVPAARFAVGSPLKLVSYLSTGINGFSPSERGCLCVTLGGQDDSILVTVDSKLMTDTDFIRFLARLGAYLL